MQDVRLGHSNALWSSRAAGRKQEIGEIVCHHWRQCAEWTGTVEVTLSDNPSHSRKKVRGEFFRDHHDWCRLQGAEELSQLRQRWFIYDDRIESGVLRHGQCSLDRKSPVQRYECRASI